MDRKSILCLPNEILQIIVRRMGGPAAAALAQTCRRLREVVDTVDNLAQTTTDQEGDGGAAGEAPYHVNVGAPHSYRGIFFGAALFTVDSDGVLFTDLCAKAIADPTWLCAYLELKRRQGIAHIIAGEDTKFLQWFFRLLGLGWRTLVGAKAARDIQRCLGSFAKDLLITQSRAPPARGRTGKRGRDDGDSAVEAPASKRVRR